MNINKYIQGNFCGGLYTPSVKDSFDSMFVISIIGRSSVYFIS